MNTKNSPKKQSKGPKKANRVNLRQATSSLQISTPRSQFVEGRSNTVSAPIAQSRSQKTSAPKISHGRGSIRIQHREFISNVTDTNGFGVVSYAVNPGLPVTFPWLAPQAAQYEQYRFHRLAFEYITRSSTTVTGSVILAPDYDAADAPPVSEAAITAYQDAIEDVPWRDIRCNLQRDSMHPLGPRKFIRTDPVADDIKTYDVANMFVATSGSTTNPLGKLWVEYDVEFFVPTIAPVQAIAKRTALYQVQTNQAFTTNVAETVDWVAVNDPLGLNYFAGEFHPPPGVYNVWACFTSQNSVAELFASKFELRRNASPLVQPLSIQTVEANGTGAGAGQQQCSSLVGQVSILPGYYFNVYATLGGATGALVLPTGMSQILISLA